jgi:hypothetical protein
MKIKYVSVAEQIPWQRLIGLLKKTLRVDSPQAETWNQH